MRTLMRLIEAFVPNPVERELWIAQLIEIELLPERSPVGS